MTGKFISGIPNLLTLTNLAAGLCGIIFIMEGKLTYVGWFLLIALVADLADGFTARLLKADGALGAQLDSLADLVSFGVFPLLLYYHLAGLESELNQSLLIVVSIVYVCSAAFRLAKFNLSEDQTYYFKGLPTPAAGLAVFSLCIPYLYTSAYGIPLVWEMGHWSSMTVLILAILMNSPLRFVAFKFRSLKVRDSWPQYLVMLGFAICIALFGINGMAPGIMVYLLVSFLHHFIFKY